MSKPRERDREMARELLLGGSLLGRSYVVSVTATARLIAWVRADENEACTKIAESIWSGPGGSPIPNAIRARLT